MDCSFVSIEIARLDKKHSLGDIQIRPVPASPRAMITMVGSFNVNALVKPTSNFYVNDYANILSDETEQYIMDKSVALHNIDGTQIVVVTVPNLEGRDLESYATELFRSFGIGDKEKNNGDGTELRPIPPPFNLPFIPSKPTPCILF